ncbi:MAG TPA: hypothetical protein VFH80_34300 [Solirubrobacteraceae bacterium]|nr:hypothetical protein [Solirubrobacteraceae bacterium]
MGGVDVSGAVTVTQADCTSYGYCGWFADVTAAPASQGCATYQASQLVAVGELEPTVGTITQDFRVMFYSPGSYDICLFIDGPTSIGTDQFLAQTSYTVTATAGTVASQQQSGGLIGGTITINQPYCSTNCIWFGTATEQDGGGSCPTYPGIDTIWVGPIEDGLGTYSWPYSFTPDVSAGSISVCVYVEDQLVGAGTFTFPPAPPPQAGASPRLTFIAARNALRHALTRRYGSARGLALSCSRLTDTRVRCQVRFNRAGRHWSGTATARLSGQWIYMTWHVAPTQATPPPPPPPTTSPSTNPSPAVEGPGSYSHTTDSQFCATHVCIANFPNGRGYIVQCTDGEWSHSGGLQGACSDHGGESQSALRRAAIARLLLAHKASQTRAHSGITLDALAR